MELSYIAQWIVALIERRAFALANGDKYAAQKIDRQLGRAVRSMFNDDVSVSYE